MPRLEQTPLPRIGIICYGQLAKMTAEAANSMGVITKALGPGKNSPASYAGIVGRRVSKS